MNALKLTLLIFFLSGYYQLVKAGEPVWLAELKAPQVREQKEITPLYVVKKPINSINLNNLNAQHSRNILFSNAVFYRPRAPRESSDWILLRTNVGHVINLGHMIYTDIININIPCTTYTNADRIKTPYPSAGIRKMDITLVSAVTALSITGLVLAPIINCITGSIRYNNSAHGTYAISADMDNGLGLVARF